MRIVASRIHADLRSEHEDEAYSSPENLFVIPERILVRSQRCVKRGGRLLVAPVSQIWARVSPPCRPSLSTLQ
jgi:head-tail adaptor